MDKQEIKPEKNLEKIVQNRWVKEIVFPTVGALAISTLYSVLYRKIEKASEDKQPTYKRALNDSLYAGGAVILSEATHDYKK